jgi:DNA-binding response OmpR family regulator
MLTPECYLISSDAALRAAIREQWASAAPAGAALREAGDLSSSPIAGAVLLDAPLLDKKALALLRDWSARGEKPKIFLLGEIDPALKIGDDENLVTESFPKPVRLGHLFARLHFHLQPARAQVGPLMFGAFRLEPSLRQVIAEHGAIIRLTEKETHLLEYLGRSKHPVAREELLAAIWGYDARIDTHTLETHIYRLRRKLDPGGERAPVLVASAGAYRLAARAK